VSRHKDSNILTQKPAF